LWRRSRLQRGGLLRFALRRIVLGRFLLGRLVLTRLTGHRLRSGDGLNLRRGLWCRRGSRSGCRRIPGAFLRCRIGRGDLRLCGGVRSEQGAKQFTRQRTIVVGPGDGWQLRQSRSSRQHSRKWYYVARELGEENLVPSAVESAV